MYWKVKVSRKYALVQLHLFIRALVLSVDINSIDVLIITRTTLTSQQIKRHVIVKFNSQCLYSYVFINTWIFVIKRPINFSLFKLLFWKICKSAMKICVDYRLNYLSRYGEVHIQFVETVTMLIGDALTYYPKKNTCKFGWTRSKFLKSVDYILMKAETDFI